MDARLRSSIDRLRESVDALRETIEAARGERWDNGAGSVSGDDEARDIQQRLQFLARLEQDGLISEDEYNKRKDEMLGEWSD